MIPTPDMVAKYAESMRRAMATPQQTSVPVEPVKDYAAGLTRPELSTVPEDQQFKASYNPASALLVALGLSQQRENNVKAENQKASLQEYGEKLKNAQDLNQHQELNRIKKADPDYQEDRKWKKEDRERDITKGDLDMQFTKLKMANYGKTKGGGAAAAKLAEYKTPTPEMLKSIGMSDAEIQMFPNLPKKNQLSSIQKYYGKTQPKTLQDQVNNKFVLEFAGEIAKDLAVFGDGSLDMSKVPQVGGGQPAPAQPTSAPAGNGYGPDEYKYFGSEKVKVRKNLQTGQYEEVN